MARTDSRKSSVCASGASLSAAKTAGTKTSSHSSGLWRISFSSGCMGVPPPPIRSSSMPPWIVSSSPRGRDGEDVVAPRGHVEVEPLPRQVASPAVVDGRPREVLEAPRPPVEVAPRQRDVALALVIGVVDGDEAALVACAGPGESHEGVPRPVPFPGGTALEELPVAVAEGRVLQTF